MPSYLEPSTIRTGPGRIHVDVVSAAADLYSTGSSATLAQMAAVVNQPLASPSVASYTAGVSGDTTRVLAASNGPFYVGDSASDDLQDLFRVVSASDDSEIFNSATQDYVRVAGISPTTIGSGFGSVSLTLTFNTPIPPNVGYRIYYGRRITVANMPVETLSNPVIRRSANRVRFPEFIRGGYAATSVVHEANYSNGYPDPYLAQWRTRSVGTPSLTGVSDPEYSGTTGFVSVGHCRHVLNENDSVIRGTSGPAFMSVYEKDIRTAAFGPGTTALTKIDSTLVGSVTSPNIVTLNAADYFFTSGVTEQTAIRLGLDMLEITFAEGSKGVYVITSFVSLTEATVSTLGGAVPNFTAGAARIRWIRPTFFAGAFQDETDPLATGPFLLRGAAFMAPGAITTDPTEELAHEATFFGAGTLDPSRAGVSNWNLIALSWGAYVETSGDVNQLGMRRELGALMGDGSVITYGGRIQGLLTRRSPGYHVISTTPQTLTWNPHTESLLAIRFTGYTAKTVTLVLHSDYAPVNGDTVEIMVHNADITGISNPCVVVWPDTFRFSGTDGDVTGLSTVATNYGTNQDGVYMRFQGTYLGGLYFFTRTDYEVG